MTLLIAATTEYSGPSKGQIKFVSQVPEDKVGYAEYGYTYKSAQALPLTEAQWQQFSAYQASLQHGSALCWPAGE